MNIYYLYNSKNIKFQNEPRSPFGIMAPLCAAATAHAAAMPAGAAQLTQWIADTTTMKKMIKDFKVTTTTMPTHQQMKITSRITHSK